MCSRKHVCAFLAWHCAMVDVVLMSEFVCAPLAWHWAMVGVVLMSPILCLRTLGLTLRHGGCCVNVAWFALPWLGKRHGGSCVNVVLMCPWLGIAPWWAVAILFCMC